MESTVRSAMAIGAALLVALVFGIYLQFFQTPLEMFSNESATMENAATGSSRKSHG